MTASAFDLLAASATSFETMVLPIGASAIAASFRCWIPKGMPVQSGRLCGNGCPAGDFALACVRSKKAFIQPQVACASSSGRFFLQAAGPAASGAPSAEPSLERLQNLRKPVRHPAESRPQEYGNAFKVVERGWRLSESRGVFLNPAHLSCK